MHSTWLLVSPAFATGAGGSAISQTEVEWMMREVAPVVEQVAGGRFETLPELVMADPDQIAEVVYQEQLHLLHDKDGIPEDEAQEHARRTAVDVSGAFAGKYGFLDGKLYLSVQGIEDSMALEGAPEWMLRPMVRVVIAHELTHALLDQYTDLEALVHAANGGDAIMAINCAVEGHAVWVHEQVGEQAGLGAAVDVMTRMLGYDVAVRRRMDPSDFYHTYVYGLGRDFIAYQAEKGGTARVWQVLAHPPDATSMIVKPSTWDDPVGEVDPDVRRVMRSASKRLAGKGWRPDDGAIGDYDVRDQLVRAGGDSEIADDLDVGWNSRLVGGAMAGVEVQLLRFKSVDGARAFVDDMRTQAEEQARMGQFDPFISANAGSFDRVRSDRSAREAITVTLLGLSAEDRLGRIWVSRGREVVQIVLVNSPASDREVAASIDQVFRGTRAR